MFSLTALGGTFDIIHDGHFLLIQKAISISEKIIIGLTSDSFIAKKGKKITNNFEQRFENLQKIIHEKFPDCSFEIAELNDDFGPAVIDGDVDALVVSNETHKKGGGKALLRQVTRGQRAAKTEPVVPAGDHQGSHHRQPEPDEGFCPGSPVAPMIVPEVDQQEKPEEHSNDGVIQSRQQGHSQTRASQQETRPGMLVAIAKKGVSTEHQPQPGQ